jgi:exonuclease VII small subunit
MSTAHEHARLAMKAGVKALEGEDSPTLEDFKTARDLAKSAHETLKAACDLLSKGINQVMEEDEEEPKPDTSAPLFQEDGQPVPVADLSVPALGFTPQSTDAELVDPPEVIFGIMLDQWEKTGFEEGRTLKEFKPIRAKWNTLFKVDTSHEKRETLNLLRWAMENTSNCWCDPQCAVDLQAPSPREAEEAGEVGEVGGE